MRPTVAENPPKLAMGNRRNRSCSRRHVGIFLSLQRRHRAFQGCRIFPHRSGLGGAEDAKIAVSSSSEVLIFSLAWSKPFPASKLSSRDFVMPRPFDGRARCIEFWLSNKREADLRVVADSEEEEVQMYEFQLDDMGHHMHLTEGYWIKPHLISPD
jgi:hypothetical protein